MLSPESVLNAVPGLQQKAASFDFGGWRRLLFGFLHLLGELSRVESPLFQLLQTLFPGGLNRLSQRFVEPGVVVVEEAFCREVEGSRYCRVGIGDFDVVKEADQLTITHESLQQQFRVEIGGSRRALFRECGGITGGFSGLQKDGFQTDGTPGNMSRRETDGDQQVIDAFGKKCAIGDLRRTGFFGENQFAVVFETGPTAGGDYDRSRLTSRSSRDPGSAVRPGWKWF